MTLSEGKKRCLEAASTAEGRIAALAMDQRKSLRKMIAAAAGKPLETITDQHLSEFKAAVTKHLTPHASAILLDPEYGIEAAKQRSKQCGLLLTYESDGYENPRPHRMLELMPYQSVRRLRDLGAQGIKILLSYAPGDEPANDQKRAAIERIGAECQDAQVPFYLEPVVYDPAGMDPTSVEFARLKPDLVIRTMEEFSKPLYQVDVLKVEFPVQIRFVEGSETYCGQKAWSQAEALDWFRKADSVARCPYIYLSAGITNREFNESLRYAAEAKARFSGVLCGRANWQDGISEYVRGGVDAFAAWLDRDGVKNIQAVNESLRAAKPWQIWFDGAANTKDAR
jgi:tagatose 1,6-diphosphate aldolase